MNRGSSSARGREGKAGQLASSHVLNIDSSPSRYTVERTIPSHPPDALIGDLGTSVEPPSKSLSSNGRELSVGIPTDGTAISPRGQASIHLARGGNHGVRTARCPEPFGTDNSNPIRRSSLSPDPLTCEVDGEHETTVDRVTEALNGDGGSEDEIDQEMEDSSEPDVSDGEMDDIDEPDDQLTLGQFQEVLRKESLVLKIQASADNAHKKGRMDSDSSGVQPSDYLFLLVLFLFIG